MQIALETAIGAVLGFLITACLWGTISTVPSDVYTSVQAGRTSTVIFRYSSAL